MKALLKKFIKILFYLNVITISLSCNLNYHNGRWLNEWRLLLVQEGRNQYQLLRDHNVAENSNVFMLCNRDPRLITVNCDARNRFNQNVPLRDNCPENFSIRPERIQVPAANAPHCPYILYRIGFNIQINQHRQFLETYQVCFDHRHLRTVFTINKAYPMAGVRPDFLKFRPDDFFYGDTFHAFDHKVTVKRFNKLLGSTQNKMIEGNLDHIIDRGHLTPSADFTLTNYKRSTFNMINVMPQFKTIDNGNWRRIEEWARDYTRTPADICTGVLDCNLDGVRPTDLNCVVKLQDIRGRWVPMFLQDTRKIPIPLWIYKIVRNRQQSVVFLTFNNIHHRGRVQPPPDVCQVIDCPLTFTNTVQLGWTFCCDYNAFISRNIPHLRTVC
ncbi:uncharacterized protein LOC119604120 [Lucilia sericata]|uniref:uncharacterized protein LOC119604120 n=1 Tax=Lucilia sericata TaxID=13632 RepID=UPI0018A857ED|nr:uncharacterized protein LOC119604120 [Lucilia sericata]